MLGALLVVAFAARPSVAVIVDGPADSAGPLQAALQARVAQLPDVSLKAPDVVAKAVGSQQQGVVPQLDRDKADGLLAAARHAAAEDRLADSIAAFAALETMQDESGTTPIEDRIVLRLWRASVLLSMGDRARASEDAREVLALDPARKVDVSVFRPSLAALVEQLRRAGVPKVTVTFEGLPPGSDSTLDDKPIRGGNAIVATGRHWLKIDGNGFKPVRRAIDIAEEGEVTVGMPIAIDPATVLLVQAVLRGDPSAADRQALDLLADVIGANALVIASSQPPQVAIWKQGGATPFVGPSGPGPQALVDWTAARLIEGGTAGDGSAHGPRTKVPGWLAGSHAGASILASTLRTTIGPGEATFHGDGFALSADGAREEWLGAIEGSWTTYAIAPVPARAGTLSQRLSGGQTALVAILAGRGVWGGTRDAPNVVRLEGWAGPSWRRHDAHDLNDAAGSIGLFPSWTLVQLHARGTATIPLDVSTTRGGVATAIDVAPLGFVHAWPRSSGHTPSPTFDGVWSVSAFAHPAGDWTASLAYRYELLDIHFHGAGTANVTPPLAHARLRNRERALTVSVSRRF